MLINVKMPTIVGILTFMSRINFMPFRVEHKTSFIMMNFIMSDCHGGHLGYWKGRILAILNLHVAMIPSTKFLFISVQHMDLDSRNLSSGIREQQRRRPACTSMQTDQHLLLFPFWKVSYLNLLQVKFQLSS